jgi:hypothetical protein
MRRPSITTAGWPLVVFTARTYSAPEVVRARVPTTRGRGRAAYGIVGAIMRGRTT